jgi:glycosyltransferase involved in cell wall biosynthesis
MKNKLSIITINWNNAKGLRKTIESVVSQINDNCQYIVIDGDSHDESTEIIREFEDQISYWVSEPNRGIYGNMNRGIKEVVGEYCLFLNSGDCLNNNILTNAIKECSGEDIIYFNTYLSYDDNRYEELKYSSTLSMRNFFKATISHQSTLIKTDLFSKYGLYNENNRIHSDYEFWLKSLIIGNCSSKYVNQFLAYYDMGGRSSKPDESSAKEINNILTNYFPIRVLNDYEYWYNKEKSLQILMWYKRQKYLYKILVFLYKVIKNIRKLLKIKN